MDPLAEPNTDPLPTRQTLLSRLRDWQDEAGWREFFESYWRLIYNVARKSGLRDTQAQEVVQNTFLYLSRRMPKFHYDPAHGSFKSWLRVVTRSRINVYCRTEIAREKMLREPLSEDNGEELPDPAGDVLDKIWQEEWEQNLIKT